jgi:hypothetical protein
MRGLRALLACLLVLCWQPAVAWPAHGVAGGGGGYTGPGDLSLSSPQGWWGLRAYSTAWADGTHKAVRITRASDSQLCDVFLNTAGGLGNVTSCSGAGSGAVATFCNATTCTISKWYDQSGNSRDYVTGSGNPALLVFSCIGALPCARFDGTDYYELTAVTLSQPITFEVLGSRTGGAGATAALFIDVGNNINVQYTASANTAGMYAGSTTPSATASDNAFHILQYDVNGASSSFLVDATTTAAGSNPGSGSWSTGWVFGAVSGGGAPVVGDFTEFGIWNSAFQSSTLCHNAFTYWGTPTSC